MQPWGNIRSQKVLSGMAWKHRPVTNKTRMFTFLHDIAKTLAKISKMHQQSCLTDKDHPEATSCKPIYHGNPVISNFLFSKTSMATANKMIWQALQKRCKRRQRSRKRIAFVSVDFLIPPKQYANTCMAVLIRHVTCKSLLSFWGQGKVLSCEIHFRNGKFVIERKLMYS